MTRIALNAMRLIAASGFLLLMPSHASAQCSVEQVLELSKLGMSQEAIKNFCDKGAASDNKAAPGENVFSPETVLLEVEGRPDREMLYTSPGNRSGMRALGYGGQASYLVFPGKTAKTRVDSKTPSFLIAIPENVQPESYVFMVQLKPKRGDREMRRCLRILLAQNRTQEKGHGADQMGRGERPRQAGAQGLQAVSNHSGEKTCRQERIRAGIRRAPEQRLHRQLFRQLFDERLRFGMGGLRFRRGLSCRGFQHSR